MTIPTPPRATRPTHDDSFAGTDDELSADFAQQFIGRPLPVLLENCSEGMTENYLKARLTNLPPGAQVGDVIEFVPQAWQDGALND